MYNGILPVFKERGLTSHDVVFKLRKILKMKKIGHTGTLDPEVNGVLPICLGDATKVSDYIMEMGKTTLATDIGLKLGFPAHMSRLTRIASGGFQLESSLTIDQIKELHEHDSLHNELFPIEYGLKGLKSFQVKDSNFKKKICNGQKFHKKVLSQNVKEPFIFVDSSTQKVLAIYIVHPDKPYEIKPKKVFN